MFAIAIIILFCMSPAYISLVSLPDSVRLVYFEDEILEAEIMETIPLPICVRSTNVEGGVLRVNDRRLDSEWNRLRDDSVHLGANEAGTGTVEFRLMGFLPLGRMTVEVVEPVYMTPAGHAIGVIMKSEGVIVADHIPVSAARRFPARDAGIRVGDILLDANGESLESKDDLARRISEAGEDGDPLVLSVKRDGEKREVTVWPEYDGVDRRYKIGLLVRDGTAGIGTLTAFDENTGRFMALGHEISDPHTRQPLPLRRGNIVSARISSITQAQDGIPGEKVGIFKEDDDSLGVIEKNTSVGIVGTLLELPESGLFSEELPVAFQEDVRSGPAKMVTVIEDGRLEMFDVDIESVRSQSSPEGKSMVVRITDPRLLDKTGGIVQGMSGSPIIQDNRFVGAVTHVFVNDPKKGYGVYAEWLAAQMDLLPPETVKKDSRRLRGIAAFAS